MIQSKTSTMAGSLLAGAGLALSLTLTLAAAAPAHAEKMGAAEVRALIDKWPMESRKAAMATIEKYGPPQEATATTLMWRGNGPWKFTRIDINETRHDFPAPHIDVMEQAIDYRVSPEAADELARYDGSVYVDRTQGMLSARCDKEGANFLALNLANDIITKRRDVADARQYYARAIKAFMSTGQMDPYMQGLRFPVAKGGQGDPDRPAPMS
jgi:hypothetical protein